MTIFDRFFESELDATINETEFILRDSLNDLDDHTVSTIFNKLTSHREEFLAYLTATGRAPNGKEARVQPPPRTPQGKSHRLTKPPPPDV
jgi:hypothetical protein